MNSLDQTLEVNFDGLVGPTHNFAGLAPGNLASMSHRNQVSSPRLAAQQGLSKMRLLHQLGVPQAVLPPQARPDLPLLRRLGFAGSDSDLLNTAKQRAPHLLAIACSGSSMWTANAATVAPSVDTEDGRVHLTPANLATSLHRANEVSGVTRVLRSIFNNEQFFCVHEPLPAACDMRDEGAANHTRLSKGFGHSGIHLFVYGDTVDRQASPKRFAPRQSLAASRSVARLNGLCDEQCVFVRQHPQAIDSGVFHNDVISVGHRHLFFCHQDAFANQETVYELLTRKTDGQIRIVEVRRDRVDLTTAVQTYLFNSQIVTTSNDRTVLAAPVDCQENPATRQLLDQLTREGVFDEVRFVNLRESMNNGGGPACLRLRVELTPDQHGAIVQGAIFNEKLDRALSSWIDHHYRDQICQDDLADPKLMDESHRALDELTRILELGSIYEFQR